MQSPNPFHSPSASYMGQYIGKQSIEGASPCPVPPQRLGFSFATRRYSLAMIRAIGFFSLPTNRSGRSPCHLRYFSARKTHSECLRIWPEKPLSARSRLGRTKRDANPRTQQGGGYVRTRPVSALPTPSANMSNILRYFSTVLPRVRPYSSRDNARLDG